MNYSAKNFWTAVCYSHCNQFDDSPCGHVFLTIFFFHLFTGKGSKSINCDWLIFSSNVIHVLLLTMKKLRENTAKLFRVTGSVIKTSFYLSATAAIVGTAYMAYKLRKSGFEPIRENVILKVFLFLFLTNI